MAGCESAHHGLGGLGVGVGTVAAAHLSMSVPLRTLEITPVKDAPPLSDASNTNTTMSVLTPVKAERLQQAPQSGGTGSSGTSQDHHETHHQPSSHHQSGHQTSHHHTADHTRISTDIKSIKTEGILQFPNFICF